MVTQRIPIGGAPFAFPDLRLGREGETRTLPLPPSLEGHVAWFCFAQPEWWGQAGKYPTSCRSKPPPPLGVGWGGAIMVFRLDIRNFGFTPSLGGGGAPAASPDSIIHRRCLIGPGLWGIPPPEAYVVGNPPPPPTGTQSLRSHSWRGYPCPSHLQVLSGDPCQLLAQGGYVYFDLSSVATQPEWSDTIVAAALLVRQARPAAEVPLPSSWPQLLQPQS